MAKKGKVGTLDAVNQYIKNKLPQTGFFSTLDELVGEAPFEKAPMREWKNYLKPGRTFEREGVRFPLKQEELDYTFGHPHLADERGHYYTSPDEVITKGELRRTLRELRPDFRLTVGIPRRWDQIDYLEKRFPEEFEIGEREVIPSLRGGNDTSRRPPLMTYNRYGDYAHEVEPDRYEESILHSPSFGAGPGGHFGPDVISHSRTTIHPVAGEDSQQLRLIEEIQSDRHQQAADRLGEGAWAENFGIPPGEPRPRRGYRTPGRIAEIQKQLRDLSNSLNQEDISSMSQKYRETELQIHDLANQLGREGEAVADAPFKSPADYGLFELKNQLLNATKADQNYLGLVRGSDVSSRFSQGSKKAEGTSYVYDQLYRQQLEKLARQYGANVHDVPTNLVSSVDLATPTMRQFNMENTDDLLGELVNYADSTNPEEVQLHLGRIADVISELGEGGSSHAEHAQISLDNLSRSLDQFSEADPFHVERGDPASLKWLRQLQEDLSTAHEEYAKRLQEARSQRGTKTFPAMELTPEIREKIKKAGVPIWALTGASLAGLGANEIPSLTDEEEVGYADGGKVRTVVDAISKFLPKKEWNDKLRREKEDFRRISGGASATLKSLKEALDINARKSAEADEEIERIRSKADWVPPEHMAEGGEVNGLDRLREIAENVGTEQTTDRRKRILAGLASQWYGMNDKSKEPEFLGGDFVGYLPGVAAWRKAHGEPEYYSHGPGILDEIKSMGLGTKGAEEADERLMRLKNMIRARMVVQEPHGLEENFDDALGTMLGQIPLPAKSAANVAQKLGLKKRLTQLAKKVPDAAAEWFFPTINPSAGNYLTGAGFGASVGAISDYLEEKNREEDQGEKFGEDWLANNGMPADWEMRFAEGGEVSEAKGTAGLQSMLSELRSRLEELKTDMPIMAPVSDNTGTTEDALMKKIGMAKGGKVKTLLELREMLARNLDSPNVEGTGREMVPITPDSPLGPTASVPPPESIQRMVENPPIPSAPFQMNRRNFLQGAASLASPGNVTLNPEALLAKQVVNQLTQGVAPKHRLHGTEEALNDLDEIFYAAENDDYGEAIQELDEIFQRYPRDLALGARSAMMAVDKYTKKHGDAIWDDPQLEQGLEDLGKIRDDKIYALAQSLGFKPNKFNIYGPMDVSEVPLDKELRFETFLPEGAEMMSRDEYFKQIGEVADASERSLKETPWTPQMEKYFDEIMEVLNTATPGDAQWHLDQIYETGELNPKEYASLLAELEDMIDAEDFDDAE